MSCKRVSPPPTVLAAVSFVLLLAPLAHAGTSPARERREAARPGILAEMSGQGGGESGHSKGCWARGVWYPEGAVIDLKALKGVQSLSVTPVLFVCRDGALVSVSAEK